MTSIVAPPEIETAEDVEAKRLMKEWEIDTDVTDDDDISHDGSILDAEEELEPFRRTVTTQDNAIDHIVLGTSDLMQSIQDFENMTGTKPLQVTSLTGLGTKSARVAFDNTFLEIVGPDPKQNSTLLADKLSGIEAGKMVPLHYAVRSSQAKEWKRDTWPAMGFGCDQVMMVAKDQGMPWNWDLFFLQNHTDGGLVPYFINWGESFHASAKLPIVGSLEPVKVQAPSDSKVHKLLEGIENVTVESGEDLLEFTFSSSKGSHTFSTSAPIGISFPEEGGLPVKKFY